MNKAYRATGRVLRGAIRRAILPFMGTITGVSTDEKIAALTFDDGPNPEATPALLEILNRHGAKATFFMVGRSAERYPDIVRKVAESGHSIGVHSWDHPSFPSICGSERRRQITACERALHPYGDKLFRPPFGHQSVASRMDFLRRGYKVIAWNVHAFDWEIHDSRWTAERLSRDLRPGGIILLHDALFHAMHRGAEDRTPVLAALDAFLEGAGDFSFVTVPDLLRAGRPDMKNWFVRDHDDWG